jgi:chromosome segregation ATPase
MSSKVNEGGARALVEVERDVALVAEELEALKAERDGLPALVEAATKAFDSAALEELGRRGRSLEAQGAAAQARLYRHHAERARAQLPAAEAEAGKARAEYDRAHAEYLELYARVNRLGVEADNARARAFRLRQSIEENERRAKEVSFSPARQS